MLFGDEHRSLVEMERLARDHIGCRVAHGSRYYHAEGHHQQSFNMLPAQVMPGLCLHAPCYMLTCTLFR